MGDSSNGCGWTCNAGYYKSGSSCNACTSSCTGNTQETTACTSTQNRICTSCTKPSNSVFSQAQDAVGLVILAITKVAVIVLLVLHVQLNNRKQKVAHPHKIVNAGHYARLNLHQQVIVSP